MNKLRPDWSTLFDSLILWRGQEYFRQGKVGTPIHQQSSYSATVAGSIEYKVDVKVSKSGDIAQLSCNCPYAAKGERCKHMAAVLYRYEEDQSQVALKTKKRLSQPIEQIIDGMELDSLKQFVLHMVKGNKGQEVLLRLKETLPKQDKNAEKFISSLLDDLFHSFLRHDLGSRYIAVDEFANGVHFFLKTTIAPMIELGERKLAFDVVSNIAIRHNSLGSNIHSDHFLSLEEQFDILWGQILAKETNEEHLRHMYAWFEQARIRALNSEYQLDEIIFHHLIDGFQLPDLLKNNLALLDKLIKSNESDHDQTKIADYICLRAKTMKKLGMPQEKIQHFFKRYWLIANVREHTFQEAISEERYEDALRILKECQGLDAGTTSLTPEFISSQLIELYEKLNLHDEYREELLFYLRSYIQFDVTYYQKLRCLYSPSEWKPLRRQLLHSYSTRDIKCEILAEEGLYSILLKTIEQKGDLDLLHEFNEPLRLHRPRTTLALFLKMIEAKIKTTFHFTYLYWLEKALSSILQYPSGKKHALAIMKAIKSKISNPMLEEDWTRLKLKLGI